MNLTISATFPGDASATDLTPYYKDGTLKIERILCDNHMQPTVDSCSFELIHNDTITTKFLDANDSISITISGDQTFTGVADPTFEQVTHEIIGYIRIECRDNSYMLEEYNSTAFSYPSTVGGTAYKIFDPSDTANSVVHQLLDMAGYNISTDISGSAVAVTDTITHISREKEEETYWEIISTLLWEYGYIFYFTEAGLFSTYQWIKDTVTATQAFTEKNICSNPGLTRIKEYVINKGAEVEWHTLETKSDALLYREPVPFDSNGLPSGISILDDQYYPTTGNTEDIFQVFVANWLEAPIRKRKQTYQTVGFVGRSRQRPASDPGIVGEDTHAPAGEKDISLIATSGHTIEDDYDTGFTRTETFYSKRAKVLYRNESGATADLYYFDIRGDALFRKMRKYARSMITGHSSSTQIYRYQAENIFDASTAQKLAIALRDVVQYGDFTYKFRSTEKVDPGTIATITADPSISTTVIITARYVKVVSASTQPYYEYEAIGLTEYSSETVATYGQQPQSPQTQEEAEDDQIDNRPTYDEIDTGYDNTGGGTTTPTVPTVSAYPFVNTTVLTWDNQNLLRWLDRYEVQVSIDDSTWYSLELDGTDWKDTLDADTDVYKESFSHTNIPTLQRTVTGNTTDGSAVVTSSDTSDMTEGESVSGTGIPADTTVSSIDSATQFTMDNAATADGTGVTITLTENYYHDTYYYRVRRVAVDGTESAWSTSVSTTPKTIDGSDIGVESISAVHIEAGSITTAKISTGVLNALVAQINNSLEISDTYGWLAGTYDSPESGDTRAYLDPNEVVLQQHDGSSWVDKIRLGSVDAAGDYKSYFSGGYIRSEQFYSAEDTVDLHVGCATGLLPGYPTSNYPVIRSNAALHFVASDTRILSMNSTHGIRFLSTYGIAWESYGDTKLTHTGTGAWLKIERSSYPTLSIGSSNTSNSHIYTSAGNLYLGVSGSPELLLTSTSLEPSASNDLNLGTSSKKWKSLHVSGGGSIGKGLTVSDDITAGDKVTAGDCFVCGRSTNPGNGVGRIAVNTDTPTNDLLVWYTNLSSRWANATDISVFTW